MSDKKLKVQKATGASVEAFYDAHEEASKEPSFGKQITKRNYSVLILARVEPMPTFDEFRAMLDDDACKLLEQCKKANPRHFDIPKTEPLDQKKSES